MILANYFQGYRGCVGAPAQSEGKTRRWQASQMRDLIIKVNLSPIGLQYERTSRMGILLSCIEFQSYGSSCSNDQDTLSWSVNIFQMLKGMKESFTKYFH